MLWETNAILRHLGAYHGLWPAMPAGPPLERRDHAALAAAQARIAEAWAILDGWLAAHSYLGGIKRGLETGGDRPLDDD